MVLPEREMVNVPLVVPMSAAMAGTCGGAVTVTTAPGKWAMVTVPVVDEPSV